MERDEVLTRRKPSPSACAPRVIRHRVGKRAPRG